VLAGAFLFYGNAQPVSITGTIKDSTTQKGISGATVKLKLANDSTTTNASGAYAFSTGVKFFGAGENQIVHTAFFKQNLLNFGVASQGEKVRISLYNLSGRMVASLLDRSLASGNYQINPYLPTLASQVYFVKLEVGSRTAMFTMPLSGKLAAVSGGLLRKIGVAGSEGTLAKAAAAIDTLTVTASGYVTTSKPVTSYSGTYSFSIFSVCADPNRYVTWDNGSYSGCQTVALIMVEDSYLTGATVLAHVRSTADTVGFGIVLKKDPTTAGQYLDSVHFSIISSDSAKHLIKVRDRGTFNDSVMCSYVVCPGSAGTPATVSGMGVQWSGNAGSVGPGASQYFGLAMPVIVNLNDPDLTDSIAFVTAKDDADPVGIVMTLHQLTTSFGSYTGKLYVSTAGSSQANGVLKVIAKYDTNGNGENITLLYDDLDPPQVEQGSICTWFSTVGALATDSVAYHGLADTMALTLTDNDVSASKVAVQIKSKKDPTGFIDSLTFSGSSTSRQFSGKVGVSTTVSQAAKNIIAVQASDTVTIVYNDPYPITVVTRKVPWNQ
jgi:hypothetical protein